MKDTKINKASNSQCKNVSDNNLTQKAYSAIRHMLLFNEIVPGQRLLYRDLSARLNMSTTPVVQALKWMAFQGLICHEPNRGFYVESMTAEMVEEIYRLREAIEMSALPVAIARLKKDGIECLRRALDDYLATIGGRFGKQRLMMDRKFHMALAHLSGGKVTQRILGQILDLLYSQYRLEFLFDRPVNSIGVAHQAIFDRVVARDVEGAQKALLTHLRGVQRHVLEILREIEDEQEMPGLWSTPNTTE